MRSEPSSRRRCCTLGQGAKRPLCVVVDTSRLHTRFSIPAVGGWALRTAFKLTYGTNLPSRSNAFGKCVSKLAQQNEQNRSNAAAACRTERSADPAAFAGKYGTGPQHKNAFGNCVSSTAKAAAAAQVQATVNAAKSCWTERKPDPAAFKAKYGTNANKSNAFGKCVSGKVKHSTS